ncbi:MAG: hypothetical protein U0521_11985 [Anaerolineae bacterium]
MLSGFLIRLSAARRTARTGALSFWRLLRRRILRIWPLYYLIAFVGFVLLPLALGAAEPFYHDARHRAGSAVSGEFRRSDGCVGASLVD